jgi:hypothetical protein
MSYFRAIRETSYVAVIGLFLGALEGSVFGFYFLSLCDLLGKSGNTGAEYIGHWDVLYDFLGGILYGGIIGGIGGAILHGIRRRGVDLRRMNIRAAVLMLILGSLGCAVGPPGAAASGLVGYFVGGLTTPQKSAGETQKRITGQP